MSPEEITDEVADLIARKAAQGIEWPDIASMVITRLADFKTDDVLKALSATGRPQERRGLSEGHQEYHRRRSEEMGRRARDLKDWIDAFMMKEGYSPSTHQIATGRGISRSTAVKYLRWLEDNGDIKVERMGTRPIYRTLRMTYTEDADAIEFD